MKYQTELSHWGILGMKWGKRRYQNKDGSLTPAGQKRYAKMKSAAELGYAMAGESKGYADYHNAKANKVAKSLEDKATAYSKQAEVFEKNQQYVAANKAREESERYRQEARYLKEDHLRKAREFMTDAEVYEKYATDYATKNRIDLGKGAVDSIMSNARKQKLKDLLAEDERDEKRAFDEEVKRRREEKRRAEAKQEKERQEKARIAEERKNFEWNEVRKVRDAAHDADWEAFKNPTPENKKKAEIAKEKAKAWEDLLDKPEMTDEEWNAELKRYKEKYGD